MKIYVTRHGETVENETGVIQGWLDGQLNTAGIDQAKQLGIKIREIDPSLIVISDLGRCVETYDYALGAAPNLSKVRVLKDWRIRERSFGNIEGDPSAGVDWASFWKRDDDAQDYGEETNRVVRRRVARFVNDLELIVNQETVLVLITHGGVVNILKSFEMGPDFIPQKYPNAELIAVDYEKLKKSAHAWAQDEQNIFRPDGTHN